MAEKTYTLKDLMDAQANADTLTRKADQSDKDVVAVTKRAKRQREEATEATALVETIKAQIEKALAKK